MKLRSELIVVVLPAPFCPIKPIILPFGTLKLTLSNVNPSYLFVRSFISIAFSKSIAASGINYIQVDILYISDIHNISC
jgi:hypothetical protein